MDKEVDLEIKRNGTLILQDKRRKPFSIRVGREKKVETREGGKTFSHSEHFSPCPAVILLNMVGLDANVLYSTL